jgi:cytochrome P450
VTAGRPVTAAGANAFSQLRATVARTIGHTDEPSLLREAVRAPEGLSRDEIVSNAAVLMFGGIDTTEGMIVNAVGHLLGDPEALALVRGGTDLVPNAIEESIRLEPAAALVDRYATRDVELGGAQIQRGDLVILSITGANRDPAVFTDPDRFNIRRANARSTSPSRRGRTSASARSSPGPRPRSGPSCLCSSTEFRVSNSCRTPCTGGSPRTVTASPERLRTANHIPPPADHP